ncbi:tRNA nucleotidyltransferase (CCA-adding enzyme) [Clostridiales Family XIII bacterium PM5-7]
MNFVIPHHVKEIIERLNQTGHEAYLVGGCVRDFLMGVKPKDWDLCTSALPEEIKSCFADRATFDIGIDHGTVMVTTEKRAVEITTYRIDGEYVDGRHPKQVSFTRSLEEDLARRDFTINAIAYHPEIGLVDPLGGRADIKKQIIRCVGDPQKRFEEDALRILRGLRFAATLGFDIKASTAKAMEQCKDGLNYIPIERINVEFLKLVEGEFAADVIGKYSEIIQVFAPELNVESLSLIQGKPNAEVVLLCILFQGNVETTLKRLKFTKKMVEDAKAVSSGEGITILPDAIQIKRLLKEHGLLVLEMMIDVKETYGEDMLECRRILEEIQEEGQCYSLNQLAVNGRDLIQAGFPAGPKIGTILNALLDYVIVHPEENKKELLLDRVLSLESLE